MKKKQIKNLTAKVLLTAILVGIGVGIMPIIDPPGGSATQCFNGVIDPPGGGCAMIMRSIDPPGGAISK